MKKKILYVITATAVLSGGVIIFKSIGKAKQTVELKIERVSNKVFTIKAQPHF